jgi:plasmid stabilization system protein ParE
MTYRVVIQQPALDDLDEYYRWAAKHAPDTAAKWLNRFQAELQTLADQPQRCSLAPENGRVSREIRQLLFGKRPNVYRAIFTVDGEAVRVLRVRRATRMRMSAKELNG